MCRPRTKNVTYYLNVSLKELYNGSIRHLAVKDIIVCLKCKYERLVKRLDLANRCKRCAGSGVHYSYRPVKVIITPGMRHMQKILCEGLREPRKTPGHLEILLVEQTHSMYERRDNDLLMVIPITLEEVECGFIKNITTLDGRRFSITRACGDVDNDNYFDTILGEGMPIFKSKCKGQLFIKYELN